MTASDVLIHQDNSKSRSTKTRIETKKTLKGISYYSAIQNQDPLKQGLKLMMVLILLLVVLSIQNQDPLKQGLKPETLSVITKPFTNSKSRSTKTRIETNNLINGIFWAE